MALIEVGSLTLRAGGKPLLSDVSFKVERGERWGMLGRNGSGKTTLFRAIHGDVDPAGGQVVRTAGLRLAWLDQHRDYGDDVTLWDVAAAPFAHLQRLEEALHRQAEALAHDASPAALDRYAKDQDRFDREGGYAWHARVDAVLHGLGFDPDAARVRRLRELSGGERGRLGLARQLVQPADLLLLDEPTNHLDLETTDWLSEYLVQTDEASIVISHDRDFLDRVVNHVLHLEGGSAYAYDTGYRAFLELRAERRLSADRARQKQEKVIAAEEDYIRRNIAGGNSRQAKGRRRRLSRLPRLSAPPGEADVMSLRLHPSERSGDQVIVAENITLAIGGRTLLRGFSARVTRGERIGLVGPNGAGKTTLLRALAGEQAPDDGRVTLGAAVTAAWYHQDLGQVPMEQTLFDIIHDRRPRWNRGQVQGHLGRFGFPGDAVLRKPASLSGGERARLALALLMLTEANLLLLDEPTNHLDVESIEVLEDALTDYPGTVLLVSHDRALLRSVTDRTWAYRKDRIADYPGGFEDWEIAEEERRIVASAEEQRVQQERRALERKRRSDRSTAERGPRTGLRAARRDAERAEQVVHELEREVEQLTGALADPALYAGDDGAARAAELAARLAARRGELDAAMEAWSEAGSALEAIQTEERS